MQLKFYGGAQEVGRSAILMKDDRSLLFDFGVKLDHRMEFPVGSPKADALIVSHAHLDHSGFSPGLYNENLTPSFGTQPTLRLSNLLLDDSLGIAKKEHTKPQFSNRQLKEFINRYISMDYHHVTHFGNFDIEFFDAGHICGSSISLVERMQAKDYRRVVYTGDFKLSPQLLHKGAEVVKSDVLIIESTYATREHQDRKKVVKDFIDGVKRVVDNGGTALVPAFAVGRSQELLALLYQHDLAQYTFFDGMSKDATQIVLNSPNYIANYDLLSKAAMNVNWITERDERKEALNGPSVILTTGGMLHGGPVLDYITKLGPNSEIFLTGYQQEGTNGKTLMQDGTIIIQGVKHRIPQPVSFNDFSAHAGMSDLFEYVKRSDPKAVVCVHGDEDNTISLASALKEEGFAAYAPKIGDSIKFD